MSGRGSSMVTGWIGRVFPHMPDFYAILNDQCDTVEQAMRIFAEFMASGDDEQGNQVLMMEHIGDRLKSDHIYALNEAFATPMDREDIYRAINTIDNILNYAKTTIREMQTLELSQDKYTVEMAGLLHEGTAALKKGYAALPDRPEDAEREA